MSSCSFHEIRCETKNTVTATMIQLQTRNNQKVRRGNINAILSGDLVTDASVLLLFNKDLAKESKWRIRTGQI